jgi:ubiquinone/menaquinone biosynthesis C-methylase UbiE
MISSTVRTALFHGDLELLPQMNEIYELELAYAESQMLSREELMQRGAYFASIGGRQSHHFRLCTGEALRLPGDAANQRRRFFEKNQFRTGYCTHGLFPYRGKFHPQMIKGIINMMGLRPGETVLDPTMGSGTTLVEASSMGIHSIGFDASPFCRFMTSAKIAGLTAPIGPLNDAANRSEDLRIYFQTLQEHREGLRGPDEHYLPTDIPAHLPAEWFRNDVWPILLLALLDASGFAERSTRGTPTQQFRGIIERYAFVVAKFQEAIQMLDLKLGRAQPIQGDARELQLPDQSVDGIIFSPPYSFAVDYVENDAPHLRFLGQDLDSLRNKMIGLRGRTLRQKFDHYCSDMASLMKQCARVLRPGRQCTVIIGTNNQQLGKLLNQSPHDVQGLDDLTIELAQAAGLSFSRRLSRRIVGLANTMRDEDILVFSK